MMSHMAAADVLLEESKKMQSYGAQGIVLMDSAGTYLPDDVREKVGRLVNNLEVPVGFHAHNNLGLSIANSLAAIEVGARILDATSKGFGAGAGNAPLELLAATLSKLNVKTRLNLYQALDAAELASEIFAGKLPHDDSVTIVSGLCGVFSGFAKPVKRIAEEYHLDPRDILVELGRRKAVGGQEDLIVEVATMLRKI
jgi:4-hydroxy 2-oxovalerate aldolase